MQQFINRNVVQSTTILNGLISLLCAAHEIEHPSARPQNWEEYGRQWSYGHGYNNHPSSGGWGWGSNGGGYGWGGGYGGSGYPGNPKPPPNSPPNHGHPPPYYGNSPPNYGNYHDYYNNGQYYSPYYGGGSSNMPVKCAEGKITWIRDPQQCNKAWFCKTVHGQYEYKYQVCPQGQIVPDGEHESFECVPGSPTECDKREQEKLKKKSKEKAKEKEGKDKDKENTKENTKEKDNTKDKENTKVKGKENTKDKDTEDSKEKESVKEKDKSKEKVELESKSSSEESTEKPVKSKKAGKKHNRKSMVRGRLGETTTAKPKWFSFLIL